MMRKVALPRKEQVATPRAEAHLAEYRLPVFSANQTKFSFKSLSPIWEALRNEDYPTAREIATNAMEEKRLFSAEERAALKIGLAVAELQLGAIDAAKRLAGRSLDLFPNQFSAHRILLTVQTMRKGYAAAYLHLANLPLPDQTPTWDEELSFTDVQIALASWAWQLGEWDQVADHITSAYPSGITDMPVEIREDWFRLSLYRGHPDDAAAAAALLIDQSGVEGADELLQTIVQSGWTKEALPLYRSAYEKEPKSELLRRRLVALCIREGELEEARELATSGALRMAA
jgi:tetratricopeptide (TPR) repeat protein